MDEKDGADDKGGFCWTEFCTDRLTNNILLSRRECIEICCIAGFCGDDRRKTSMTRIRRADSAGLNFGSLIKKKIQTGLYRDLL
jgi:hypothetical protein